MFLNDLLFHLQVSWVSLSPAPPPAPTITGVRFTAGESFTVEWIETPGSCDTVDGFTFNVAPNDLSCTRSSMTTATCSYNRAHLGQTYTFSVATLNCDTQRGDEATITINLHGMPHNVPVYIAMFVTSGVARSLVLPPAVRLTILLTTPALARS